MGNCFVSVKEKRTLFGNNQKVNYDNLMLQHNTRKGIEINYWILFVGIETKGTKDFSKKKGVSSLDKYTAQLGAGLSSKEI